MERIIPTEYNMSVKVASYDVGPTGTMRLSAVLRYQQEAGEQHLMGAGLGWQAMLKRGMVFVTSRWHTVVRRLPGMEETVTLTTWHRDRKGPRFFRCYEWRDADGALLIEGVMQFALVAVENHRLLRGDEFMAVAPLPDNPRQVTCTDPGRFPVSGVAPAGEYRVRWSDTDRNGHLNNTHYADLMLDYLPAERLAQDPVEIDLHFAGECLRGDTLTLAYAETGDTGTVTGDTARGRSFSARIRWGE
ncbi:MAG: hypothetical protein E7527_02815 [Ruminococcaceae bacterium]|nr:hypothetical protein [Oscillospiraceae bacterium]